jgi:hypothetical protein
MVLQFNCQHCNELIISKFLKVGEMAECKKCGEKNTIPKSAEGISESTIKSENTISDAFDDGSKKEPKTLTEKYNVLELYKGLAYLMMITATGFFIYSLVQYFDLPEVAREMLGNAMIASTITYVITMFSLFCLTEIIDFLFDLDKQDKILVSDKNFTE